MRRPSAFIGGLDCGAAGIDVTLMAFDAAAAVITTAVTDFLLRLLSGLFVRAAAAAAAERQKRGKCDSSNQSGGPRARRLSVGFRRTWNV